MSLGMDRRACIPPFVNNPHHLLNVAAALRAAYAVCSPDYTAAECASSCQQGSYWSGSACVACPALPPPRPGPPRREAAQVQYNSVRSAGAQRGVLDTSRLGHAWPCPGRAASRGAKTMLVGPRRQGREPCLLPAGQRVGRRPCPGGPACVYVPLHASLHAGATKDGILVHVTPPPPLCLQPAWPGMVGTAALRAQWARGLLGPRRTWQAPIARPVAPAGPRPARVRPRPTTAQVRWAGHQCLQWSAFGQPTNDLAAHL